MLIVFAGLPGAGKTTLAEAVARVMRAALLRVDAVEAGLISAGLVTGHLEVGAAGYFVAGFVADTCLHAGTDVVVDAVNPVAATRRAWQELAARHQTSLLSIEVRCPDDAEHQRRLGAREGGPFGRPSLTWDEVRAREYQPWPDVGLVLDNVGDIANHIRWILRAADGLRLHEDAGTSQAWMQPQRPSTRTGPAQTPGWGAVVARPGAA